MAEMLPQKQADKSLNIQDKRKSGIIKKRKGNATGDSSSKATNRSLVNIASQRCNQESNLNIVENVSESDRDASGSPVE